jgi:hypothetical protein
MVIATAAARNKLCVVVVTEFAALEAVAELLSDPITDPVDVFVAGEPIGVGVEAELCHLSSTNFTMSSVYVSR